MRSIESLCVKDTEYKFGGQTAYYKGKVREVYTVNDQLIMIASDRISAFDHILPRPIPFKGQVLNQIATYFLDETRDIVPNWLEASPDPNVSIGKECTPFKIEMVIRGYLAGHAWRTYKEGGRELCGVQLAEGLKEGDKLPEPIITPSTKADEGHDEDISREEILRQGIVNEDHYVQLEAYTQALFNKGSEMARERGLILVDTKYEFGINNGKIYLIDEIHTPDSSRYYYLDGYEERQQSGEKQKQLSKEFVREWLMAHGFQGLEDQLMPEMPDQFIWLITERYIELYELITGETFNMEESDDINKRIQKNIENYLDQNN
jgi:phosphoribosylaminoimidazole-succinocarboxamide synthase